MAESRTYRRREETKTRLQRSLLDWLSSSSFQELRIEDIAETAGLSRSAFYFYYPDKRSLLMEAAAGVSDALFEQADRWWHGEGEPEELITEALTGVAELWGENRELLCTAVEVSTYDDGVRDFWRGLIGGFIDATAEHIAREQKSGEIDPGLDAALTAEVLIWGVQHNLYVLCTTAGRRVTDLVEPTTSIWMRAMYRRVDSPPA